MCGAPPVATCLKSGDSMNTLYVSIVKTQTRIKSKPVSLYRPVQEPDGVIIVITSQSHSFSLFLATIHGLTFFL